MLKFQKKNKSGDKKTLQQAKVFHVIDRYLRGDHGPVMAALVENYCLRWNDYGPNITEGLRALREDKDFFDVTLACEDAHIPAHKVVLSACSPFFKNIFRRHEHQHPLLYLKVGQLLVT